jgi:hypothetical protein
MKTFKNIERTGKVKESMTFKIARLVPVLAAGALFLTMPPALGLIQVGEGNDPVHDPGWPAGSLAVANLKARVGWVEGPPFGGGQWTFFYRGGTDQLQETLKIFSAITADRLEVILHDGRGASHFVHDWSFEVWVREHWERLFNNPGSFFAADHPNFGKPVAAPRLDVWLRTDGPDWSKITVPANVVVQDQRATSNGFPPGSGSVIRLKVTDYQGKPIPGAKLQIATAGDKAAVIQEAVADAQGAILATGIQAGTYRLSAAAPSYAPRLLEYGQYGTNDYRMYAAKLAPAATLVGRVVDENDEPLVKVSVQPLGLMGPDGMGYPLPEMPKAISDNSGHFQLSGMPVGKLQVRARLADYHYQWNPKEVMEAHDDTKTGSPTCVLRMVPTGSVRVQLVDAQDKPFVSARQGEAHVSIQDADRTGVGSWGGSGAVDTNGVCEFKGVPPGRYRLSHKLNDIILTVKPRQVSKGTLVH